MPSEKVCSFTVLELFVFSSWSMQTCFKQVHGPAALAVCFIWTAGSLCLSVHEYICFIWVHLSFLQCVPSLCSPAAGWLHGCCPLVHISYPYFYLFCCLSFNLVCALHLVGHLVTWCDMATKS